MVINNPVQFAFCWGCNFWAGGNAVGNLIIYWVFSDSYSDEFPVAMGKRWWPKYKCPTDKSYKKVLACLQAIRIESWNWLAKHPLLSLACDLFSAHQSKPETCRPCEAVGKKGLLLPYGTNKFAKHYIFIIYIYN